MGTAKKTPTMPFRNNPNFTRAARLDIPFSALIEILLGPGSSKKSDTAGPGTWAVDWRAMPPHQKLPAWTWVGPQRHRASPENRAQGGLQSLSCEVPRRLRVQGKSHRQSSWPCFLRDRRPHDRQSNRFDIQWRRVADLQERALHKMVGLDRRERRVSPMPGSHVRVRRSVFP